MVPPTYGIEKILNARRAGRLNLTRPVRDVILEYANEHLIATPAPSRRRSQQQPRRFDPTTGDDKRACTNGRLESKPGANSTDSQDRPDCCNSLQLPSRRAVHHFADSRGRAPQKRKCVRPSAAHCEKRTQNSSGSKSGASPETGTLLSYGGPCVCRSCSTRVVRLQLIQFQRPTAVWHPGRPPTRWRALGTNCPPQARRAAKRTTASRTHHVAGRRSSEFNRPHRVRLAHARLEHDDSPRVLRNCPQAQAPPPRPKMTGPTTSSGADPWRQSRTVESPLRLEQPTAADTIISGGIVSRSHVVLDSRNGS